MNKRKSQRQPNISDVMLVSETLGPMPGKMIDMSLGGICVDTGRLSIPENAAVNVNFTVEVDGFPVQCKAHAIVLRTQINECCLMFDGMSEETHQVLRSLVGDWQVMPPERGLSQLAAF